MVVRFCLKLQTSEAINSIWSSPASPILVHETLYQRDLNQLAFKHMLVGIFELRSAACEIPLGIVAGDVSLGNFRLTISFGIFRLGSFGWDHSDSF